MEIRYENSPIMVVCTRLSVTVRVLKDSTRISAETTIFSLYVVIPSELTPTAETVSEYFNVALKEFSKPAGVA
jgi:hypothetical protein